MILSNQVRCNACGDEPFSAHRHDFRSCICGAITVDGGMAYLRRIGDVRGGYTDMSIDLPDDLVKMVIAQVNELIEEESAPRRIAMIVLGNLLAGGVTYFPHDAEESLVDATFEAASEAAQWAHDNGRNGLGYVCAIARYVRDAGGVWMSPEDQNV